MGINTGYCNVGNFGSDQRLTYTIIGGEVNIAQRLESAAPDNGILMSYETYAHAKDLVQVEELESITMKGVKREIKVYSILNTLEPLEHSQPEEEVHLNNQVRVSLEERLVKLEKQVKILISDK